VCVEDSYYHDSLIVIEIFRIYFKEYVAFCLPLVVLGMHSTTELHL
jgi:hypothetical protein